MKKIVFILLLLASFQVEAQTNRFPSIDSLKNYILRYVRNSTMEAFTNSRLQNVVYGTAELLDSLTAGAGATDTTSLSNRINNKVDSVTISTDSLFYHVNGTSFYVGSIATASAGGDTTIFEVVLDSTGQQNQRVLFSKNRKIASDDRFFFDETNNKLVINAPNISVGGPNTKLFVSGNANLTGNVTGGSFIRQGGTSSQFLKADGSVDGTSYQGALSLTTTGSSGAATLIGNTLNIPQYSGGGGSQTLQQTLTQGSTLTQSNTINNGGFLQISSNGKNQFDSVSINPALKYTDTIFFSGTSITVGTGASSSANRFSTRVSQKLNAIENNKGLSSAKMSVEGINSTNLGNIPTYVANLHRWAVLEWGTNDILNAVDTATYAAAYLRYLDTMIARGWPVAKILVVSPSFLASPSISLQNDYKTCTEAVASRRGTLFLDILNIARAKGAGLFYPDNIHPNDAGISAVYVNPIVSKLGDSVRVQGQQMQINGLAEFQRMKLRIKDTVAAGSYSTPIGLDSVGNVIMYDRANFIENSTNKAQAQGGSINITGSIAAGSLSSSENVNIVGGIKGTYGRFTGGAPLGMSGSGTEIGVVGGSAWLFGYDRTGVAAIPLVFQGLGGGVRVGAPTVGNELLSVGGSGRFSSGLQLTSFLNNTSGSGLEMGGAVAGAGAYIGAYDRGGGGALTLSMQGLGGNIYFGAFTATGSNRYQFTGTGHFSTSLGVGVTSAPKATLETTSFAVGYLATATGITLNATHHTVNVTADAQTITLPTAASISGRQYTIKLTATGTTTIATTSSQTIDGVTTYTLSAQYKYVTVTSNGANWIITANN